MICRYGFSGCILTEIDVDNGSTSRRYCRTNASLTTKPGAVPGASSVESNSRPRRTGMRSVLKYPDVTTRIVADGKSLGDAGTGVPRRWKPVPPRGPPTTGRLLPAPADSTPGIDR